jgi:hypothetical protein
MVFKQIDLLGNSAISAPPAASAAARTLLLSPSVAMATPRGWQTISSMPKLTERYDEVHCVGGGSLLLFLLFAAGRAPRLLPHGRVYFHGNIIYPTAPSAIDWMNKICQPGQAARSDTYEWRQAALSLGFGGRLHEPENRWLEPIVRSVVSGREGDLVDRFNYLKQRSEDKGRLVHLPVLGSEAEVLASLCRSTCDQIPCLGEEELGRPKLVRCTETECFDETDACMLSFGA